MTTRRTDRQARSATRNSRRREVPSAPQRALLGHEQRETSCQRLTSPCGRRATPKTECAGRVHVLSTCTICVRAPANGRAGDATWWRHGEPSSGKPITRARQNAVRSAAPRCERASSRCSVWRQHRSTLRQPPSQSVHDLSESACRRKSRPLVVGCWVLTDQAEHAPIARNRAALASLRPRMS